MHRFLPISEYPTALMIDVEKCMKMHELHNIYGRTIFTVLFPTELSLSDLFFPEYPESLSKINKKRKKKENFEAKRCDVKCSKSEYI